MSAEFPDRQAAQPLSEAADARAAAGRREPDRYRCSTRSGMYPSPATALPGAAARDRNHSMSRREAPEAERTPPSPLLPWLVAVAFFMQSLDTTILNTAVPAIAHALGVAPLSMKAVLASYTLSLAVFIPISGWMADRFGTRRVFAGAIGLFTLGSLLCGLARDIHLLVACRILQGCGGAMMVPVGRLTLVRTFAKSELVRAMSFVAIPSLIGPMLGPRRRRPDHRLLPLARDLLPQHADRARGTVPGVPLPARLPRGPHAIRSTWSA